MQATSAYPRAITCPNKHVLIQNANLRELHHQQAYNLNEYYCETCQGDFDCKETPSFHCVICNFDMCPECYELQKSIQIDCPNEHPLLKVSTLKLFSGYPTNQYSCKSCGNTHNSTISPSAHCRACKYDLCHDCLISSQSKTQTHISTQRSLSGEISEQGKLVPCPADHPLQLVSNLAKLYPGSRGIYALNEYSCDTCKGRFECQSNNVYHCGLCKFDLCSNCYKEAQNIKFDCPIGHKLYIVTSLQGFNESSGTYGSNTYTCESCSRCFDARNNSSCHCRECQYDLCSGCFEEQNQEFPCLKSSQSWHQDMDDPEESKSNV